MIEIKTTRITHIQNHDGTMNIVSEVTAEALAEAFWGTGSDQQAQFLHCLGIASNIDETDKLMMQGLFVRQECEERVKRNKDDKSLRVYLDFFAAAFKYMSGSA